MLVHNITTEVRFSCEMSGNIASGRSSLGCCRLARLIAYDRAALVPYPIREAEVVDPDVVKAGAHRRGGAQSRAPAPFAMGDDVIARAESDALQHASQSRCRMNKAIIQQIGMRQMPGAREMPATNAVAGVLSSELRAGAGVEHMRRAVKLTPR